jgi:uncharacterized protein with HEPN domain
MSPRNAITRLEDILESIANVQVYIRGMTFADFAADLKTIRATAYELGIIGEATRHLPDDVRLRHPQIPWEKMQALRNIVFHEYFRHESSSFHPPPSENIVEVRVVQGAGVGRWLGHGGGSLGSRAN